MKNDDSLRRKYARFVMQRCAVDADFADLLHVKDADGRRLVVPVLDSDPVELAVRLTQQVGGDAMLAVLAEDEKGDACSFLLQLTATVGQKERGDCHLPVGAGCTLADLLKVLTPGASITLRQADDSPDELRISELGQRGLASL